MMPAARVDHTTQTALFLKAQFTMQLDRRIIKVVHVYGNLLIAQFLKVVAQQETDCCTGITVAPVRAQDRQPVLKCATPPITFKSIQGAYHLTSTVPVSY